MSQRKRKLVAIVAMLGILFFAVAKPTPAYADAGTAAAIAAGAAAIYVGVVLLFTQVIYRDELVADPMSMPMPPPDERAEESPIKLTPRCAQNGDLVTLACW